MVNVLLIMAPIILGLIVIVIMMLFFNPTKITGKMLSKQIKTMKSVVDETKDDIESISTNMANASKEGVEITARAIKDGFTKDDSMYCKYCGSKIDKDSKFCKECGKEQ